MKQTVRQKIRKEIKNNLVILFLGVSFASNAQIIGTLAGTGTGGYSGNGGPAPAAELQSPGGVAVDASGNVFIADVSNNSIRKVSTSGIISTIAGMDNQGYSGDGGPATNAKLYTPWSVAVDAAGNVYISDSWNYRIRKVNTSGIISTIAGNGTQGYSGDGGPATDAEINITNGANMTIDASGNVYISDLGNSRIRKVNTSGIISTFAGNGTGGYSGDGGQATNAQISPVGLTMDNFGNFYIVDVYCIRKINTSGIINTIAGVNGYYGYNGDGGQATTAYLYLPNGAAVDALGNVYIADRDNELIRKVNTSGIISTIAGNGYSPSCGIGGFSGDGGPAIDAELNQPWSVAVDVSGDIYIADMSNNRIRKISAPLGTDEINATGTEVNIYPVPNTGFFTVAGITQGQIIELYNYMGQKLSSTIADNTTMHFDISNTSNGVYIVRILNKDGSISALRKIEKAQ